MDGQKKGKRIAAFSMKTRSRPSSKNCQKSLASQHRRLGLRYLTRADWHVEKTDKRELVTGWEPFPGQENQPVRTLSPITEQFSQGHRIKMKAKCTDDSDEIDLSVDMTQTTIQSVKTSMFTYDLDIGGEPHAIQTPKMDKQRVVAQVRIPVKGCSGVEKPRAIEFHRDPMHRGDGYSRGCRNGRRSSPERLPAS